VCGHDAPIRRDRLVWAVGFSRVAWVGWHRNRIGDDWCPGTGLAVDAPTGLSTEEQP
jgi:hypothetical protein